MLYSNNQLNMGLGETGRGGIAIAILAVLLLFTPIGKKAVKALGGD